jgi:hypothetical protein
MQWHKEMLRGFRDNAAYEGGRYLILALLAAAWPIINGFLQKPWYWKLNGALIVIAIILFGVAIIKFSKLARTSSKKKADGSIQPKEPQPVIVAIDELKALRDEAERLVNRFQIDSVKPTFGEVEDWRKRTLDCARQNVLATEKLVGAKDLLRLEKPWDEREWLQILAEFVDSGCLRADDSTGIAVFKRLWGNVERLKELIAKIETEEPTVRTGRSLYRHISEKTDAHIEKMLFGSPEMHQRRREESSSRQTKRNEVLDRIGELIRARKSRMPNPNPSRQNMFGLLVQAGAHRLDTEEDMVTVCDQLVAAGNEHPFQVYEKEYSPVIKGEWLEFVRAFQLSGLPFEDMSAWSFAVTKWRGKNRWLNRPKPEPRFTGVELVQPRDSSLNQLNKSISIIDIIGRRLTEIESGVKENLRIVGLTEALHIEPEVAKQIQPAPKPIEHIEPQLIEEAYSIDRELTRPAFREIGIAVKRLNEGISDNNEHASSSLSHDLLRQIEEIRRLIVVIQSEQAKPLS